MFGKHAIPPALIYLFLILMTPNEIARKVMLRAKQKSQHESLYHDSLLHEISSAIAEERELLSRYLDFLNESIGRKPEH
ncbi:MAG TPA: hypothetical protein VGM92_09650, partial [Candidatus Kapabacteria bacterium]